MKPNSQDFATTSTIKRDLKQENEQGMAIAWAQQSPAAIFQRFVAAQNMITTSQDITKFVTKRLLRALY